MGGNLTRAFVREALVVPIRQLSVTASFFHAYPRIFGGDAEFSTSDAYRIGIYRLGIPYLATGIVLVLVALIANFYFLARRGVIPGADDTHESDPNERDCTARAFLLFSCFLNLAIILCISLAFVSCFTMRSAAGNAYDVLDAAKTNISIHIEGPGYTLQGLAVQAGKVNVGSLDESQKHLVGHVVDLFKSRKQYFDNLVSRSTDWFGRLDTIHREIKNMSTRYVMFTITVMLTCIIGLLLTFVCDSTTPDSRRIKIIAFSLLLIPLAATWAHTAISTWIAVASADFCQSLDEYHQAVLVQAIGNESEISESNIFIQYKLQCPAETNVAQDLVEVNRVLGSASPDVFDEKRRNFSFGFEAITNKQISLEEWAAYRTWMQDRVLEFLECETQVNMAAKLSYYVCGDHGGSGVSAVAQLWLCSFGMSLLFTAIIAILSFGHPPSEFCSGKELLYVYGAPKLISAFGDIRSVLTRHTTFRKLKPGKSQLSNISPTSSDLDAMEQVARDYNFDDDSTMSTSRPRRNAYTSHPLKDQKPKTSDWSLDHFGGEPDNESTDSSGFS